MLTFLFWSDPKPSAQQKAPVSDGTPETTVEGVYLFALIEHNS